MKSSISALIFGLTVLLAFVSAANADFSGRFLQEPEAQARAGLLDETSTQPSDDTTEHSHDTTTTSAAFSLSTGSVVTTAIMGAVVLAAF